MARDIYDKYFREAQSTPRGVVAKLRNIMHQLEAACIKHQDETKVKKTQIYLFIHIVHLKRTIIPESTYLIAANGGWIRLETGDGISLRRVVGVAGGWAHHVCLRTAQQRTRPVTVQLLKRECNFCEIVAILCFCGGKLYWNKIATMHEEKKKISSLSEQWWATVEHKQEARSGANQLVQKCLPWSRKWVIVWNFFKLLCSIGEIEKNRFFRSCFHFLTRIASCFFQQYTTSCGLSTQVSSSIRIHWKTTRVHLRLTKFRIWASGQFLSSTRFVYQ